MKRMTLLTALVLVFSLFAVTAAIAAPGLGVGEGDQDRDCRVVDAVSDCGNHDRDQAQTNAPDEEQPQTKEEVPNQNQVQNQVQNQNRHQYENVKCLSEDCQAEEAVQEEIRERSELTNRVALMFGAEGEEFVGRYRLALNFMLQNFLRFVAL